MRRTGLLTALLTFAVALGLLSSGLALADSGGYSEAEKQELQADKEARAREVIGATAPAASQPTGGLCASGVELPLYFSDFEADNGGWTASGFQSWEWGSVVTGTYKGCGTVPSPEPVGAYSGARVWGTNLNGCYANANSDTLLSRSFDLSGISGPIQLRWQHWYHVFETFDYAIARVNGTQLWRTPNSTATPTYLQQSVDLSSYAGNPSVTVDFLLHATTVVNRMGWYVDDVGLYYCGQPAITMTKTVGTDPHVCATTDTITVTQGTTVTYCYTVENTGNLTLTRHDLNDSELGPLLAFYPYSLGVGSSYFHTVTAAAPIVTDTVNTAVWRAYNSITVTASSTDTATVFVTVLPTAVRLAELDASGTRRVPVGGAMVGLGILAAGGYVARRRWQHATGTFVLPPKAGG